MEQIDFQGVDNFSPTHRLDDVALDWIALHCEMQQTPAMHNFSFCDSCLICSICSIYFFSLSILSAFLVFCFAESDHFAILEHSRIPPGENDMSIKF